MTPPDLSLVRRTLYVLLIGAALFCLSLVAGCGKEAPAAPPVRPDGPCTVTQSFPMPGGIVAVAKIYYAVCPPDSVLAATGWRRVP